MPRSFLVLLLLFELLLEHVYCQTNNSATQPPGAVNLFQNISVLPGMSTVFYNSTIYFNDKSPIGTTDEMTAVLSSTDLVQLKGDDFQDSSFMGHWKEVNLTFTLKYYGNNITTVTLCLRGFIFMNNYMDSVPLNQTMYRYVAPLMADFTSNRTSIVVSYKDTGSALFVKWDGLSLASDPTATQKFNFRCALYANGTILFHYISVPVRPSDMNTSLPNANVDVGITDGYLAERLENNVVTARFLKMYSLIFVNLTYIQPGTVVVFVPFIMCVEQMSCTSCVTRVRDSNCRWCPAANLCSVGIDRNYNKWSSNNCDDDAVKQYKDCDYNDPTSAAAIIILILLLCLIVGLISGGLYWCFYAYKHPNSPSGRWLIEHRPNVLCQKCCGKKGATEDPFSVGFSNTAYS